MHFMNFTDKQTLPSLKSLPNKVTIQDKIFVLAGNAFPILACSETEIHNIKLSMEYIYDPALIYYCPSVSLLGPVTAIF